MKYHYLRLFLVELDRPALLETMGRLPPRTNRQEYLKLIFSQRIDFDHRKSTLVYIPIGHHDIKGGQVILGRIGRVVEAVENMPPEEGFEEYTHNSWRAANILIDIRDHSDGQKIAFQFKSNIGKPLPISASLVDFINKNNVDSGWFLEVNLITEKQSFWDAVEKNKGDITAAEFTFITPNILNIQSKLNDDLKKRRKINNATSVSETMYNPEGNLDFSGSEVSDSVEYISEGGGSSKLKNGKKIIYNSENEEKVVEIDDDEPLVVENKGVWQKTIERLFK